MTPFLCADTNQEDYTMMQQPTPASSTQTGPKQQIPLHLVERLESEWKQMRESAATPAKPR